jgi:hypothetical protein
MTKEQFTHIRTQLKKSIVDFTTSHKHDKNAYKHNIRYCRPSAKRYDPEAKETDYIHDSKKFPYMYGAGWMTERTRLTILHVFYNRFRSRPPHTACEDKYVETSLYRQIEQHFMSLEVPKEEQVLEHV